MPGIPRTVARTPFGFALLACLAVALLLALIVAPGLLLYVVLGRDARTPYQLFTTALVALGFATLLRLRLRHGGLAYLDSTRFYAVFGALPALLLVEALQPAFAGSLAADAQLVVAITLLAGHAAGWLVERRRA